MFPGMVSFNLFENFYLDSCTYPVVKEDHQKAKADEDYQRHKQKSSHHGEVILSTENIVGKIVRKKHQLIIYLTLQIFVATHKLSSVSRNVGKCTAGG